MTEINRDIVAQYYIECELDNVVQGSDFQVRSELYRSDLSRLLEALSFTFRANDVFDYVQGSQYTWEEREVPIKDVTLTSMGEHISPIIYSDDVQCNPHKFAEYIKAHQGDPRLAELNADPVPSSRQTILLRENNGVLKMLDGSHRFMSMVMNGAVSVNAYVAKLTDPNAKVMLGDAIFLRLKKLWQQTEDPELKQAIERTVIGMVGVSRDGAQAVQNYWIKRAPDPATKASWSKLLNNPHD